MIIKRGQPYRADEWHAAITGVPYPSNNITGTRSRPEVADGR